MKSYQCWDREACRSGAITVDATSSRDAARLYVDGGDWRVDSTIWIHVYVEELVPEGDEVELERHRIAVDPEAPACIDQDGQRDEHAWSDDVRLVGGHAQNPGVFACGGGVVIREVCTRCGCMKVVNTWDQDPSTGEQGLRSLRYATDQFSPDELAEFLAGD
jgi:hypothetical protein